MSIKEQSLQMTDERWLALWEILSVIVSCLIAEWVMLSFFSRNRAWVILPVLTALILMIMSHRLYGETTSDIGFRIDNFWPSLRLLIVPTLLAVIGIIVVGWLLPSRYASPEFSRPRFVIIPLWAMFQQYALQGYINRRAQVLFGKGTISVVVVGIIFGLLHLPNPALSLLTIIGGLVWAFVYQKQPNLFALAISHTIASLALTLAIPLEYINGLRVGFKYFG